VWELDFVNTGWVQSPLESAYHKDGKLVVKRPMVPDVPKWKRVPAPARLIQRRYSVDDE
jgi:hypothetical protein